LGLDSLARGGAFVAYDLEDLEACVVIGQASYLDELSGTTAFEDSVAKCHKDLGANLLDGDVLVFEVSDDGSLKQAIIVRKKGNSLTRCPPLCLVAFGASFSHRSACRPNSMGIHTRFGSSLSLLVPLDDCGPCWYSQLDYADMEDSHLGGAFCEVVGQRVKNPLRSQSWQEGPSVRWLGGGSWIRRAAKPRRRRAF